MKNTFSVIGTVTDDNIKVCVYRNYDPNIEQAPCFIITNSNIFTPINHSINLIENNAPPATSFNLIGMSIDDGLGYYEACVEALRMVKLGKTKIVT